MTDIPPWFWRGLGLICIWFLGQIMTEKIKIYSRQKSADKGEWSGEERRQTLMIDDEMLTQFLSAYKEHIKVVESLLESSRAKNDILLDLGKQLKEHIELEDETRARIQKIYHRMIIDTP